MAVIMALQEPPASESLGPQAQPRPPQPRALADPESPNFESRPVPPRFGRRENSRDFPDPGGWPGWAGIGEIFGI